MEVVVQFDILSLSELNSCMTDTM